MFNFRFSIFVVSILLASALGLNPKYPSILFALELLENRFLTQAAVNTVIGCKVPRNLCFS